MFKKVRNYFVLCAVALISVFALAACGDDDDEPSVSGKDGIVGEWLLTHEKFEDIVDGEVVDSGEETYHDTSYVMKFSKDGTAYFMEDGYISYAQWSLSGSKLTLNFEDEYGDDCTQVADCKINGNTMTLKYSEKGVEDGHTYEYHSEMTLKRIEH